MTPLLGFAPDIDPTTKGAITACANLIPTIKGMKGGYSGVSAGVSALAAACKGAAVLKKIDGTSRFFAGTTTDLYEAGATSFSSVTRAVGGAYNGGSETVWRFCQYGNVSIASQLGDTIQYSNGSGAFANISGAPKAFIVETVNDFIMALGYNDGTEYLDGWHCSALGDYTDWTPSIATQCANGRLLSTPGRIRAGRRFGDGIVAYKDKSMYFGVYAGPPVIWEWREITTSIGAPCQEVVVPVAHQGGFGHVFMGNDDFYYFDGARPIPIGGAVREWFFGRVNRQYIHLSKALHDTANGIIYWFYPTTSITLDSCIVYNYLTQKWGTDDRTIEACIEYVSAGDTYSSFQTDYATYDVVPSVSYGSLSWSSSMPIPAFFDSSHVVKMLTGDSSSSSLTTGDLGDDKQYVMIDRVRPRFITKPTTGSMTNYYRDELGDSLTQDQTVIMSSSRFDVLRSSRWHRVKLDFTGNMEMTALDISAQPDGTE